MEIILVDPMCLLNLAECEQKLLLFIFLHLFSLNTFSGLFSPIPGSNLGQSHRFLYAWWVLMYTPTFSGIKMSKIIKYILVHII